MADKEKDQINTKDQENHPEEPDARNTAEAEASDGGNQQEQPPEMTAGVEDQLTPKTLNNHIALKRGRMIAAGVIAAVVLCVIAIAVAGIFQLSSRYLMPCPKDLSVNDPAPVLWKDVVAQKDRAAILGVPKSLMKTAELKRATGEKEQ